MSAPIVATTLSSAKQVFGSPNQPVFEVALSSYYNCRNQGLVQIKLSDDASTDHLPSTVVLVIDVSGSMGSMAATSDDSDGASGLSQLDVVKHAARAIIESLHEQDQLAVVSFCSNVKLEFNLTFMTPTNRGKAWKAVDKLQPSSSTNLYGGLVEALRLLRDQDTMPTNSNIMLLTDGVPNVSPPRGELTSLRNFLDANPRLAETRIATFGFGYSLKSQLLTEIAQIGRSLFSFIPDASFVGTVFVNAVANMLAAASTSSAVLKLEVAPGMQIIGCSTGQNVHKTSWGLQIDLPSILYGQTLEVMVETKGDPSVEPFRAFLEGLGPGSLEAAAQYVDAMDPEDAYFCRAGVRGALIGFIHQAGQCKTPDSLDQARSWLEAAKRRTMELNHMQMNDNPTQDAINKEISDIQKDLEGQVTEAYSRLDWHNRWGVHYILSLARAHSLQQCSNFKDPGLQTYATQKFSLLRDAAEAKFVDLPPPTPSRVPHQKVTSMRAFYNASSGCFGQGLVLLADGTRRDISTLQAGDVLQSAQGPVRVRCVVETPIPLGVEGLVALSGGVTVTPWHPVRPCSTDRKEKCNSSTKTRPWIFPYQSVFPQWLPCLRVFNLVLEHGVSTFRIGDFDAVSLGHGIEGDPVASHAFWGTAHVVKDLSRMPGWKHGYVVLPPEPLLRDPETGAVIGLASLPGTENIEKKAETFPVLSPIS